MCWYVLIFWSVEHYLGLVLLNDLTWRISHPSNHIEVPWSASSELASHQWLMVCLTAPGFHFRSFQVFCCPLASSTSCGPWWPGGFPWRDWTGHGNGQLFLGSWSVLIMAWRWYWWYRNNIFTRWYWGQDHNLICQLVVCQSHAHLLILWEMKCKRLGAFSKKWWIRFLFHSELGSVVVYLGAIANSSIVCTFSPANPTDVWCFHGLKWVISRCNQWVLLSVSLDYLII